MRFLKMICLLLLCSMAFAQESKETNPVKIVTPYKLVFVISELQDGKKINQRSYSMLINDDDNTGVLKTGSRVPILTGKENAMQYMDVGVNIIVRLTSSDSDWLGFDGNFDISNVLPNEAGTSAGQPIVRQNRHQARTKIRAEKPTVLASMDDVSSTRTTLIEVTATRIK